MSYKKAPSIKHINKKAQLIAQKKAFDEHVERIMTMHPQLKKAIDKLLETENNPFT